MRFLLSLILLLATCCVLFTQAPPPIYLQIEEINSTDVIKYYPGDKLKFSTIEYPKAWHTETIKEIRPEEKLIILSTGYIRPEDIHSIQRTNRGANIMGHVLDKFAAGWFVFGAYATVVDTGYKMSVREMVIGGIAIATGWLIRKLFGKKNYPMGKFYRVRIMDIRFPSSTIQTP